MRSNMEAAGTASGQLLASCDSEQPAQPDQMVTLLNTPGAVFLMVSDKEPGPGVTACLLQGPVLPLSEQCWAVGSPPNRLQATHNGEPWVVRVLPKRFVDGVEDDVEAPQEGGGGSHHLHNENQHTIPAGR